MTHAYREITYTAPLSNPLELEAYLAPAPGDWRVIEGMTSCHAIRQCRIFLDMTTAMPYMC